MKYTTAILLATTCLACGRELYPGQYAQMDPAMRQWFESVRSPRGVPCCHIADGHPVSQYEKRLDDHFWVFLVPPDGTFRNGTVPGAWYQVPKEAELLNVGNPNDSAIVWYIWRKGSGEPYIRCFVPKSEV